MLTILASTSLITISQAQTTTETTEKIVSNRPAVLQDALPKAEVKPAPKSDAKPAPTADNSDVTYSPLLPAKIHPQQTSADGLSIAAANIHGDEPICCGLVRSG